MNPAARQPFEDQIRQAIDQRLQAERAWLEFIAAVAAGRIKESLADKIARMRREIEQEQSKSD